MNIFGLLHCQDISVTISGLDKSCTYVRDVLKIKNLINCSTWLFFKK